MYFAKNLRYLRKKAGHTQEFLADYLGYKNYTTIQKWESGSSEPSLNVVSKLAELYNVSMDDLAHVDLELSYFKQVNPKQEHPSAMFKREGLKALFSASEDLTEEDLEYLSYIAKKMKRGGMTWKISILGLTCISGVCLCLKGLKVY